MSTTQEQVQRLREMRELSDSYAQLMARWRDALPYSQEVANLDATFKAKDRTAGSFFASGGAAAVLDRIEALEAELERVGQDARRYQWLRLYYTRVEAPCVDLVGIYDFGDKHEAEMLDGEIDGAMAAFARRPDSPEGASQDTHQG